MKTGIGIGTKKRASTILLFFNIKLVVEKMIELNIIIKMLSTFECIFQTRTSTYVLII